MNFELFDNSLKFIHPDQKIMNRFNFQEHETISFRSEEWYQCIQCRVCESTLQYPVYCSECHKFICSYCISSVSDKCCNKLTPDYSKIDSGLDILSLFLGKIQVYCCIGGEYGCEWHGTREKYLEHEKECTFDPNCCIFGCGVKNYGHSFHYDSCPAFWAWLDKIWNKIGEEFVVAESKKVAEVMKYFVVQRGPDRTIAHLVKILGQESKLLDKLALILQDVRAEDQLCANSKVELELGQILLTCKTIQEVFDEIVNAKKYADIVFEFPELIKPYHFMTIIHDWPEVERNKIFKTDRKTLDFCEFFSSPEFLSSVCTAFVCDLVYFRGLRRKEMISLCSSSDDSVLTAVSDYYDLDLIELKQQDLQKNDSKYITDLGPKNRGNIFVIMTRQNNINGINFYIKKYPESARKTAYNCILYAVFLDYFPVFCILIRFWLSSKTWIADYSHFLATLTFFNEMKPVDTKNKHNPEILFDSAIGRIHWHVFCHERSEMKKFLDKILP